MKKYLIKLLVIISLFTCVFTVNAATGLTITVTYKEGHEAYGKVQYTVDDGTTWVDIEQDNQEIPGDVESMKIRVVPNEFYEAWFSTGPHLTDAGPGVEFSAGGTDDEKALLIGDGYPVTLDTNLAISLTGVEFHESTAERNVNVSVSISTADDSEKPIEYWEDNIPSRFNFFIGGGLEFEFGGENLTWKDEILPPNATGVSTTSPVGYEINYDNSGEVEFMYHISNASTEVASLIINDVDYTAYCPHTDQEILDNIAPGARSTEDISFNIPYSTSYNIQVVLTFNDMMGGFGWNYLPEETQSGDTREDCIAHGTLTFVSGWYNGETYGSVAEWNNAGNIFNWTDGDKNYIDERDAWGSAAFPKGAKITMRLVPDPGYQLTSLYGDENIKAQNDVGVYSITMTGGMNSHLMATFEKVGSETKVTHDAVSEGSISIADNYDLSNHIDHGTLRLNVDPASNPSEDFNTKAEEEEAEIQEYFDLNLDNIVNKPTALKEEPWITNEVVDTLTEAATVSITLKDALEGEAVVLHEKHDGTIEVIENVQYNAETKTVTFSTSSFSNYALGSRSSGTYNIDLTTDGHGEADGDNADSAAADETGIMLIVIPDDGYVYDYVEAEGINEDDTNGYSVLLSGWPDVAIMINKMPANDVSFMVHFAEAVEITYDANGGIPGELWRDTQLIKQGQHEDNPFNIFDDLIKAPEGKEYDGVIIDGVAYGPDDPYDFNDSVTIVYQWKDVTNQDECIIHFDLDGAKPGPYYEEEATLPKGEKITIPNIEEIKGLVVIPECKEYSGFILNGKIYEPGSEFEVPNEDEITIKIYWKDNHNWLEWTIITEATETKTGLRKRICKNNPEHYQIEIIPIKAKREVPDTKVV